MRIFLTVLALGSVPACTPSVPGDPAAVLLPRPHPLIVAHRGASAYAPEHTFVAWDLGISMGADYIEQDLQLTADGVLVVLHDETLDRTARGPGCRGEVRERTLAELEACEVGTWFLESERAGDARVTDGSGDPGTVFPTQRIPTLESVLRRYGGRARFYIETKSPESAPGMEEALAALLRRHGLAAARPDESPARQAGRTVSPDPAPVLLQSFSAESLRRLQRLLPDVPRIQLVGGDTDPDALRARLEEIAGYADGVGPAARLVDPSVVEAAHRLCLEVHPYTVNERAEMERLFAAGVDGIFTDRPDVGRAVVAAGPPTDRPEPSVRCRSAS